MNYGKRVEALRDISQTSTPLRHAIAEDLFLGFMLMGIAGLFMGVAIAMPL